MMQHSRTLNEGKPLMTPEPGMSKIGDNCLEMATDKGEVDIHDKDITSIGYFGLKPKCLQVFNNPRAFLLFMCCFAFVQGFIVNGVTDLNTTSLEKRFNLPSSRVGWVSSAYDIAAGIAVIPISYFGAHAHKPRLLAIAVMLLGIGSLIMSIPHFATGNYEYGSEEDGCFPAPANTTICESSSAGLSNYLYVLILGQVLHGLAGTTLFTIGISTIDDVVTSDNSPVYLGIFTAMTGIGPAVGFLGGGKLLSVFVDVDKVDTSSLTLTKTDPGWVGAWWIPYVISVVTSLCLSVPLFGYGRELPCAAGIRAQRISQAHDGGGERNTERNGFGVSIRDLPGATWSLLKNPAFLFVSFAEASEGLITFGFLTFLPKFIQNQFGLSDSLAAMLTGIVCIPGATVGQLLGGIVCKVKHLKVRGMSIVCVISCVLAMTASIASFSISCDGEKIAGVTVQYNNSSLPMVEVNLKSTCNEKCGCTTQSYSPVCADNGVFYFSQCHAGCLGASADRQEYYNCSCVLEDISYLGASTAVTAGKCASLCVMLYVFGVCFFAASLFMCIASVPGLSITLRCVPDRQRAFSVGLQSAISRFLGSVPGPILFGAIFDSTCIQWQETCGERASCWIYNRDQMRMNLIYMVISFKLLSLLMFFLANHFYKAPLSDDHAAVLAMGESIYENRTNGVGKASFSGLSDDQTGNEDIIKRSSASTSVAMVSKTKQQL